MSPSPWSTLGLVFFLATGCAGPSVPAPPAAEAIEPAPLPAPPPQPPTATEEAPVMEPEPQPELVLLGFTYHHESPRLALGVETTDIHGELRDDGLQLDYRARVFRDGSVCALTWSGGVTGEDQAAWLAVLRAPPIIKAPVGRGGSKRVLSVRTEEGERSHHVGTSGPLGALLLDLKHRGACL